MIFAEKIKYSEMSLYDIQTKIQDIKDEMDEIYPVLYSTHMIREAAVWLAISLIGLVYILLERKINTPLILVVLILFSMAFVLPISRILENRKSRLFSKEREIFERLKGLVSNLIELKHIARFSWDLRERLNHCTNKQVWVMANPMGLHTLMIGIGNGNTLCDSLEVMVTKEVTRSGSIQEKYLNMILFGQPSADINKKPIFLDFQMADAEWEKTIREYESLTNQIYKGVNQKGAV